MGVERAKAGRGTGRIVHRCGGQLDPLSVPVVPVFDGCNWGLPSRLISPGVVSPTGYQRSSSQEEELSQGLLPQRRRRRQAGSWRLSLCSAVFLVDAGNFPDRTV